MADDDLRRRAAELENRTVMGGAPVAGGPTMASSGAFDTVGGGDLGGPGSRDPGDSTSDLRDPADDTDGPVTGGLNAQEDVLRAQGGAQGATDATDAQGLQDSTRSRTDEDSADNDDSL